MRMEAEERARELARLASGKPARDASEHRSKVEPAPAPGREFFVAPQGDDRNPGTANFPFATLSRALAATRSLIASSGRPPGGIALVLEPGVYPSRQTLTLDSRDSGTAAAPLVIKARHPGTAVIYGGKRLQGLVPVTDPAILDRLPSESRGRVWQCDLRANGISDLGRLYVRGKEQPIAPATLEVYADGKPLPLARWPNQGFVRASRLVDGGDRTARRPTVLGLDSDRLQRWATATDPWLFGYFKYLWADATLQIARIDPTARTLTSAEAYNYNGGADNQQGIIFYAFNLLEEIDRPGEWYLDRASGKLYLYPPSDQPANSEIEVSLLNEPMLAATGVSHVRLEGLVFDLARGNGIVLTDATDCLIAGCTIQRFAGTGLLIHGGHRDVVLSSTVRVIGRAATEVIGGDRATLEPGGHVVENCLLEDFGRIDRTYTPGVQLEGAGNRIAHCLFTNCPSSAARIEGNDHVLEYNETRHAVLESDDQGAMEMFGNPTYRGVVFRHNLFRDIGPPHAREAGVAGGAGIRLDDVICGVIVQGNVFHRSAEGHFGGIQINSGRDNIIDGNLFIDCREAITGGYEPTNYYWQALRDGQTFPAFIFSDLYRERYPEMKRVFTPPHLNHAWRNIAVRTGAWPADRGQPVLRVPAPPAQGGGPDGAGPVIIPLPRLNPDRWTFFGNALAGTKEVDCRVEPDGRLRVSVDPSLWAEVGLPPIPMDEIGPYTDSWRKTLPAR